MKNGWYVLNYHDVSWEENRFLKGIGGSFPPDIFRGHLKRLSEAGVLVAVGEGYKKLLSNSLDKPYISIWFDDGFVGVRKYAKPIMELYGIQGAVSLNADTLFRRTMFWRAQASYIAGTDSLRILRERLRPLGYSPGASVKMFIIDHFNPAVLAALNSVYHSITTPAQREDAFRVYDDAQGIKVLMNNGWEICNHSTAHFPIGEEKCASIAYEHFAACEQELFKAFGVETRYWVIPFDREQHRGRHVWDMAKKLKENGKRLVLVGNRMNISDADPNSVIYRIAPPKTNGDELVRFLKRITC